MAAGAANVTRGTAFAATLAAERTVLDVPPEVPGGTSMGQVSIAAEKVALGPAPRSGSGPPGRRHRDELR